jgi:hypothetical protein
MSKRTPQKKTPKTPPVSPFMKALEDFCRNHAFAHEPFCPGRIDQTCDCGYQQALKAIVEAHLEAINEAVDEAETRTLHEAQDEARGYNFATREDIISRNRGDKS